MDTEFQELADCIHDLRLTGHDGVPSVLTRFLGLMEQPGLSLLIKSHLPDFSTEEWWNRVTANSKGRPGEKSLIWPEDRPSRVACQLGVCRAIANRELKVLDFTYPFYGLKGNFDHRIQWFAEVVLDTLLRDIKRLAALRSTPPVIGDLLKQLPPSGDATFDGLLQEARDKFQDKDPALRKAGLDKLWDAWERLKTLEGGDKKTSIGLLLDDAAPTQAFRDLLEREARELTRVGNDFQIRHWERGTAPVEHSNQIDYLFHRLFALVWLVVSARVESSAAIH